MSERIVKDGVVYESNGQGGYVVVGYEDVPLDPTQSSRVTQAANEAAASALDPALQQARIEQVQAQRLAALANAQQTMEETERASDKLRLTEAQKKVDEKYAEEYVTWTAGGGSAGLENNLRLLEDAIDILDSSDTITGPVIGRMPKFIQQSINPNAVDVRADVERVIQQSLKSILGAQFAMREADQLFARSFDPTQSEESNIKRIRSTLNELRERGKAKDSAARYYEKNKTIAGWRPDLNTSSDAVNESQAPLAIGEDEPIVPPISQAPTAPPPIGGAPVGPSPNTVDANALATTRPENNQIADFEETRFSTDADKAYATAIHQLYLGGATADELRAYAKSQGQGEPPNLEAAIKDRDEGRPRGAPIPNKTGVRSQVEQNVSNFLKENPSATAVLNAGNALFAGAPASLWGTQDQLNALNRANPRSAMLGQFAGGTAGAIGANKLLTQAAAKAAPRLGAAMAANPVASNVASDAVYSGLYGYNQGYDPVLSAALGAGGSAIGGALGKGVGRVVGGAKPIPEAQILKEQGVGLSTGRMLGGAARNAEDVASSYPFLGGQIEQRASDSFRDFNRRAFEKAGERINFTPNNIGQEGLEEFRRSINQAYSDALDGQSFPIDKSFLDAVEGMRKSTQTLPPDLAIKAEKAIQNRIDPLLTSENITGDKYQQAIRGLRSYISEGGSKGFERDYSNLLGGGIDALNDLASRQGNKGVVSKLSDVNDAFKNFRTIEDATQRAKSGQQTGDIRVFTPFNLQGAVQKTEGNYGGSNLRELADTAQAVLPSRIPNSGTANRMLPSLIAAGLAGAGGAGEYATTGDVSTTGTTLGALGVASLLGTRAGQKMLQRALFDRPELARKTGSLIGRNAPYFGSVGTGAVIANQ